MRSWEEEASRLRKNLQRQFPTLAPATHQEEEERDSDEVEADVLRLVKDELRPQLFDYQRDLAAQVVDLAPTSQRVLLSLPTGGGKTRTAVIAMLDGMASGSYSRVAWLAPSVELVTQAFETFESMWKGHGAAPDITLSAHTNHPTSSLAIWLSTPQAIYSRLRQRRDVGKWDVVVFDEAHQLGARTFRSAVDGLLKAREVASHSSGPFLLGLSATPGRVDPNETEDLIDLFGGRLLKSDLLRPNPVRVLQRRGVLARLKFRRLSERIPPANDEVQRLAIAARACAELASRNRRVLAFTGSVAGAIILAEILVSLEVPAAPVHSRVSSARRKKVIESLASGEIRVLTNQRLLATGYDCPAVSDVVITGPVQSPILFEQMVGRAARGPRTGGAAVATVWDFDDHLKLHGLPQSYYRFRDYDWSLT